jgi:hypothetical protein
MKRWLTPSRVSALLWVLSLAVVVWLALDPSSPISWRDSSDSVEQLTEERACTLARVTVPGDDQGNCHDFTSDGDSAQLELNGRTVCFLKAARWFIVDEGIGFPCPPSPPMEPTRITDFDDEQRAERRWTEAVRTTRMNSMVNSVPGKLETLVKTLRARSWPGECPRLGPGKAEALDARVIEARGRWHFITGEDLEAVLQAGAMIESRFDALQRLPATLLLVDASVKQLPLERASGRLEAIAALVDWKTGAIYCARSLVVVQQPTLVNDHAFARSDEPPIEWAMAGFKERVSAELAELTREMTDGGLVLQPTW